MPQGQKVAVADSKELSQVPLSVDFSDEEKLGASDKAEDKVVLLVKKGFANLNPKTKVLTDLQKKQAEGAEVSLTDFKKAETDLMALQKEEEARLDQFEIAQGNKTYWSSILCCVGTAFCLTNNPAFALIAGGTGSYGVSKVQGVWEGRGNKAVTQDLKTVRAEIAKLESELSQSKSSFFGSKPKPSQAAQPLKVVASKR